MPDSMAKRTLVKTNSPAVDKAQADNFKAETALLLAKARGEEIENTIRSLKLEELTRTASTIRYLDSNNRTYDINTDIVPAQVNNCIQQLSVWERESDAPVTIRINSDGGVVTEGLALFDFIRSVAARDSRGKLLGPVYRPSSKVSGIYITTIAFGLASSMAAVLLQAGNRRVAAPNAAILVHDIQAGAKGSIGQIQDDVSAMGKWNTKLQNILTERAKITQSELKDLVSRKQYWMEPKEAKKYGLVDDVGHR